MKKLIALTALIISSQSSHAMKELTAEQKEIYREIDELEAKIRAEEEEITRRKLKEAEAKLKAKEEEIARKREARKKNVDAIDEQK